MQLGQLIDQLKRGLDTAQGVAATASALGVPYAGLAKALLEIAQNVSQRIEEGQIVATSEDRAAVASIIGQLQVENDRLAAEIDQS